MSRSPLPLDPLEEARRQWHEHGWDAAADGMAAVTSIMRAHQIVLSRVDAVLRPMDLSFARYELLVLLHFSRTGTLPLTTVSARLQVRPPSVTNAVDRLETDGLVRRAPHLADGRRTLVSLTPGGRALAITATQQLNAQVFAALGMGADRTAALVEVLTELREGAGDFSRR